ncbi:MAG: hypothetical protein L6461_19645 [Anaerolineae bacterium]|nr:hypothetical protein [Anaerolineae bacterium]
MADSLYFQWQNEYLLKTIYPLREVKLRDFLVYFAEIDIWADYKDKPAAALEAETRAYHEAQKLLSRQALDDYNEMRAYFMTPDMRAFYTEKFGAVDEFELAKINQLHAIFIANLPKLSDVRKEKYFISQHEPQWVNRRTEARRLIAQKKRRVEGIAPTHPKHPQEVQELDKMEDVMLPMIDEELIRLRTFIKTFEKIEGRKLELFKAKEAAQRRTEEIKRKLPPLETNLRPLEAKHATLSAEINRLKNPPDYREAEKHFANPNPASIFGANIEASFLKKLSEMRKTLMGEYGYANNKTQTLRNHLFNWQQYLKELEKEAVTLETNLRNMPASWARRAENETRLALLRGSILKIMGGEIEKLTNFQAGLEATVKTKAEIETAIKAKEQELARVEQNLAIFRKDFQAMKAELTAAEATLATDETTYLTEYKPAGPVTNKHIARAKVEQYRASLIGKTREALLEEIVQRFIQKPERYPLWLQYMVIHFSGMRYKSAHGSWASPADFLGRWQTHQTEKTLKGLDDSAIETRCREKLAQYADRAKAPALARSPDKTWAGKRDMHLKGIASNGPKTRRAALSQLVVDESKYDLSLLSEEQVLAALLGMKNQFPAWMWKEIIALTLLRVKHVNEPLWEKLSPEEEAQKNAYESGELRALLGKWKEENMSGWREEHERSHQLIVTRAVCNETAEHCQHLRGHNPPGGLTSKAPWYMKQEKEAKIPGEPRPYFTKPKKQEDFTVGASILWLRFVQEEKSPWRIARPLVTKDGDGLLPAEFRAKKAAGGWKYTETDIVIRTRTFTDAEKKQVTQKQWLRWIHEATVAAVGDTADGPVVLTFETALPDDDPGLSAIGLFRIWLSNALFMGSEDNYNGSFVGFVPENQLPVEHLEEMLDWNKILRRQVMTPAELQAWRKKYIRQQ